MAAKIPQSLKFTEGLQEDLKFLAGVKGMTYNGYVESILSSHVLVQKRTVMEMKNGENNNGRRVDSSSLHMISSSGINVKKAPLEIQEPILDNNIEYDCNGKSIGLNGLSMNGNDPIGVRIDNDEEPW